METIVVDDVLRDYQFEWRTNPYRIVDSATGQMVQAGPRFDLRRPVLEAMRKKLDATRKSRFKRPTAYKY